MATTVKAGKTATKRSTPVSEPEPSVLEQSGSDFEVLRLTTRKDAPSERVPLFYIDDTEYSVAKKPGVNVGLQFMHLHRTEGETAAVDYLLGKLLGEDGYRALREYEDLTPEQFQQITEIATKLTLGAMELPKA